MNKIVSRLSICLIACVIVCACTAVSYAETLDKILVVVNGETITQAELDAALFLPQKN